MKKLLISALFFPYLSNAQFLNKGAHISLTEGAVVAIQADVNNSGLIHNDGKIIVLQNWNNDNPMGGFTKSSRGTVELNGENQLIKGAYPVVFPILYLSGTGVKKLEQDVEVFRTLLLGDRELSVNKYQLTLSGKAPADLQRIDGFISTEEKGYFYREMESNHTYTFPMGAQNGSQIIYRPVTITPSINEQNNIGVSFLYKDPNLYFYNRDTKREDITAINSKYFHVINRKSGNASVEAGFLYNSNEGEPFNQLVYWSGGYIWEKAEARSVTNSTTDLDKTLLFNTAELKDVPVALASFKTTHNLTFYNSFTPDGDGKNDTWSIDNIDDYPDNEITIFNRWGGEVFKAKSFSSANAWDGSKLNDGTYYYLLRVKIGAEYKVFKGFVSLLKGQK